MGIRKIVFSFVFVCLLCFLLSKQTLAVRFDLVAPSGTLERGQPVVFTINIDTQSTPVTSIQSGLTYDTQYLQYVSVAAGSAMNSVVADTSTYGTGKILLTGTNNTGFNGTGVFATVTFNLIAQSPGSTEICTLWAPTPTPSPTTSQALQCNSSCTSASQCPSEHTCYFGSGQSTGVCRRTVCQDRADCVCPQPTYVPQPTALPQSGISDNKDMNTILAIIFIAGAGMVYYISQKGKYQAHSSQSKSSSYKQSSKHTTK